jgi:dimethylhistidine N-methyltransferase
MDNGELEIYETNKPKLPTIDDFASDVNEGLSCIRKNIKPKYFYDEIGSNLFEQICVQPEYYLTRTEADILRKKSAEIALLCPRDISIVELGSGSSCKTRILFRHLLRKQNFLYYFPIDVSRSILRQSVQKLSSDFSNLYVIGISSDYAEGIDKAIQIINTKHHIPFGKLILFLGSSIGNLEPTNATSFLNLIRDRMEKEDLLLIGFDLQKKDQVILNAAYNDKAGVTAKFNMNLLSRINRELGGHFDLGNFYHHAFYNHDKGRIEMHLVSNTDQRVRIDVIDKSFDFKEGESIHTENSYKYSLEQIHALSENNGFELKMNFLDKKEWFNLALLSPI